MWIEIKKDIFESSDFKGLNFILQLLTWHPRESIPRYNVFVSLPEISTTKNYESLSEFDKKHLEDEFDRAITEDNIRGQHIISTNNQNDAFNIEEAIIFLNQPIYLVLENSLNDRYFLETIFWYFGKKTEYGKIKLIEFVKNNWIQFVNAGGYKNIENYVKGQLKSYEHLSAIYGKETYEYMRCFVMMDSDKQYPQQDCNKSSLKERLNIQNIKVHILKKFAMENYMPDEVIERNALFLPFQTWVNVYKRLSDTQKDHLNYKDGFPKKKIDDKKVNRTRTEQGIQIQDLYPKEKISDTNYMILDNGLKLPKFKNTFPSLFQNSPLVHKKSLIDREGGTASENEFLEILQKINDLL